MLKYCDFSLAKREGENLQSILDSYVEQEDLHDSLEEVSDKYRNISSLGKSSNPLQNDFHASNKYCVPFCDLSV